MILGMVSPVPEHLHTVTPRLAVSDGAAAIDFYARAFGAEEIYDRFTGPGGVLIHTELRIGDSVVMITQDADSGGSILATYWPDVDAAWQRALDAGAEVVYPLGDQFYGERGGRVRDPYGHQWMMAQRTEELSHEEMMRRAAEYFGE
jgi:PhnB protein